LALRVIVSGGRTRGELLPVIFFAFSSKDESGVSKDQLIMKPTFHFLLLSGLLLVSTCLEDPPPPLIFFGHFGLGSVFTQLLPKESVSSFNENVLLKYGFDFLSI